MFAVTVVLPVTTVHSTAPPDPPTGLNATQEGPTNIGVSWTAPVSGAAVTGYRIFYSGGTDQGSVDVGASVTEHTITVTPTQSRLTYSISIVTLSSQLPSSVLGPIMVTVGKQNITRFLFCTDILHITYNSNYHYQTNMSWKEKINNRNSISFHYVISLFIFLIHGISFL